jgi:hypothetical protein
LLPAAWRDRPPLRPGQVTGREFFAFRPDAAQEDDMEAGGVCVCVLLGLGLSRLAAGLSQPVLTRCHGVHSRRPGRRRGGS